MDIIEALVSMGINQSTLSQTQKEQLDVQGFLHLPGILPQAEVDAINRRQQELLDAEGSNAG